MPTSSLHVAPRVLNLVEQTPCHARILDVGPGWGKYATLLREYLNKKPVQIDAVEAWAPYVQLHGLRRLYDEVFIGSAAERAWQDRDGRVIDGRDRLGLYDVVLMVDVIEHMTKADARSVVDACAGFVVICTPIEFFHNGDGLPPTEEHVSHWTAGDFSELALGGGRQIAWIGQEAGAWIVRLGPRSGHRTATAQQRRVVT